MSRSPGLFAIASLLVALSACPGGVARDDTVLRGSEAAAIRLAIDDFSQHHYSASGDLAHYQLRLHRENDKLEIDFIPDTDPRGPYPGGGTAYGKEVIYTVSLQPLKILNSQLTQ